jgi:hypothetical protein
MQKIRNITTVLSRGLSMATQSLLQEPASGLGCRRSLFNGNSGLLLLRKQSSYGASCRPVLVCAAEGAPRSARFGYGRLSFSSQLLAKEGERKVSSSAAAVGSYSLMRLSPLAVATLGALSSFS